MCKALSQLASQQGKDSFVEGYQFKESEALGILIAHHYEWDGRRIMEVFESALEDANYHSEAAQVAKWIES